MTPYKIFTISGLGFKVYTPGHGSMNALKYATKLAFIDVHNRTPGIPNEEDSTPEEIVWSVKPGDELQAWASENQDHPRLDFRCAEAILQPVDPKQPFTEDVYFSANPKEVENALTFFTSNLPSSAPSPATSSKVSRRSGTSKASTK